MILRDQFGTVVDKSNLTQLAESHCIPPDKVFTESTIELLLESGDVTQEELK